MPSSVFSALKPLVLRRLEKEGFLEASPIQELAIPAILNGEHVLLIAPTGTGKTLAATLPVLDKFLETRAERTQHGISILDRKSTRLNSSHRTISYAVFCLKKKNQK